MIFQRQDINIADRLQIISLQKVLDALGQLGSVFVEGTGKMISRYRPAGSVILMDCRCLVALVTQEKYACECRKSCVLKKLSWSKTQPA